jgi:HK97 family phage portal protein
VSLIRSALVGARYIRNELSGTPAPWDDYWYSPVGMQTSTGIRVTAETAKQISAVYSCISKISKTLGMLPLKVYSDLPDGGKKTARNHPLFDVLYARPNSLQTAFEWRQMMQSHLELRGNAYSEVLPGPRGAIDQLLPMHPDRVQPEPLLTGRVRYKYNDPLTNKDRYLPQEMVFHLRNGMDNNYQGQSTVSLQADTFGLALAERDNYGRLLKNDSRTSAYLTGAVFKTDQDEQLFKEKWQREQTQEKKYRIAVLPPGMDIKSIGISAKDAELLDARKFSRIEICSLFDVPPHLIGETEKTATYASVEQFNILFATFCILPRLIIWEQAIQRMLMFSPKYYPKFSMGALLRGDTAARYAAYEIGIRNGWLSQNDVRIAEDLNPIADGDNYWRPMNWARLGDVHTSIQQKSPGNGAADDEEDQTTASSTSNAIEPRYKMLLLDGASRCVRKEMGAVQRMIERGASDEEVREFYQEHSDFISKVLRIPKTKADEYCQHRAKTLAIPEHQTATADLTKLAFGGIQ